MSNSTSIGDYLGYGTHAARPSTPPTGTGIAPIYYETDTTNTFQWTGSAWTQINGGGGGSSAMTLITDTLVSGSVAANIDFTSIAGTYKHLRVIGQVRGDTTANNVIVRLRMNADSTSAHYQWQYLEWYSGGTANGTDSGSDSAIDAVHVCAANSPANWPGTFTIDIPNYAGTVFDKNILSQYGYASGGGAGGILNGSAYGTWLSTAAITELKFFPAAGNFIVGSRMSLYGIS